MSPRRAVVAAAVAAAAAAAAVGGWQVLTAREVEDVPLPPPVAVGVGLAVGDDAQPTGAVAVEDARELADTRLWVAASQEGCPPEEDAPPCELDPSLLPRFTLDALLNADVRLSIQEPNGDGRPELGVEGVGTYETEARLDLSDAPVGTSCVIVGVYDDPRERIERDAAPAGHVFALAVVVERPEPFHCRSHGTLTEAGRATWAQGCSEPLITAEPERGRLRRQVPEGQALKLVLPPCEVPRLVTLQVDGRLRALGELPAAGAGEDGLVVDLGVLEAGVYQAAQTLIETGTPAAAGEDGLEWWAPTLVSQPVWVTGNP